MQLSNEDSYICVNELGKCTSVKFKHVSHTFFPIYFMLSGKYNDDSYVQYSNEHVLTDNKLLFNAIDVIFVQFANESSSKIFV